MADLAAHDELLDARGHLRGPWRRMLGTMLGLGTAELRARRAAMDRNFADLGASGRVATRALPWRCDPVPILLSEGEFSGLAAALAERADLIEQVLQDAYGPRRLVAEGGLPPALLYPAPRYMRVSRGMPQRFLHFYAADLYRAPDGQWRVLADRTAHPGGLGYAIENRRAMAQALPELFRNSDVFELRPFFEAWTDTLKAMAPPASPGLALLSPGSSDARFFEHVVIARALGLSVVEDGDLTVHGGALWLKTLRGLQPVHVLLRFTDGSVIDPLELHGSPDAASRGTPGLLHAMREGRVQVANAPGAGFAQTRGLFTMLPGIAGHLGRAALRLPQHDAFWLGDTAGAERAAAEPGLFQYCDAFSGESVSAEKALAEGARHVAERRIVPSAAPCSGQGDMLEPRGFTLRLFLLRDGDSWRPLPGGVARVMPQGGDAGSESEEVLTKDVWVLREDGGVIGHLPGAHVQALAIQRVAGNLPSRIADDFYWLGRYLERIDSTARLMRALLIRLARGSILPHELPEIAALARCLHEGHMLDVETVGYGSTAMLSESLRVAMTDDSGGLAATQAQVQALAGRLRDRLSGEMHAAIMQGLRGLKGQRLPLRRGVPAHGLLQAYCDRVAEFCATIGGYIAENMVRGGSRLFLDLGRRIERAQSVAVTLRHALDQPPARIEAGLTLALELCDSTITYRGRYLNVVQPAPVFDLVLADEANPRGLAFQLQQARDGLLALEDGERAGLAQRIDPLLAETAALVAMLLEAEDQAEAASLARGRLAAVHDSLAEISDAVTARYFTPLRMHSLESWGLS